MIASDTNGIVVKKQSKVIEAQMRGLLYNPMQGRQNNVN